ncbi:Auxin-responsive protein [Melia azedarach]|uniref:Auxin-responsive protein n=1 Tax=Melia azedarach TaxID=155640 RepID=A0ACC1WTN3_MELAZ|nr:Auxin-responsive protein [Melia azedarach]
MISLKKLIFIALKWRKIAGIDSRTISMRRRCRPANKGHFVVYSTDMRRFVIPLAYLHTNIFRELFRLSEEEFGLPIDGPIILPCNAALLAYVVYIIQKAARKNIQKALLLLLVSNQCAPVFSDKVPTLSPCPISI